MSVIDIHTHMLTFDWIELLRAHGGGKYSVKKTPANQDAVHLYDAPFMTLLPGDVISTGTPAGVGLGMKPPQYLKAGDVVELGIDQLGESRQTVVAWQPITTDSAGSHPAR